MDLVKEWRTRCIETHSDKCDKTIGSLTLFKPQLLIDVARYCIVSCTEDFPRYLALSYTWGQTKSFRTTRSTIEQLKAPGSLKLPHIASQIPKTIKHAVELTQALGEKWLWVDSLCVVQDDEVALSHELKQMHRIYASSFLTIIAKDGNDADYGLRGLYGISEARSTEQSTVPLARNERLSFMDTDLPTPSHNISGYGNRMWTCQEQVFSKRCLTFESGYVTWQCNCANWTEHQIYHPEADQFRYGQLHQFRELMKPQVPALNKLTNLIQHFNKRNLNFDEDVFDAFSGFHTHLNGLYPSGLVFGHPELYFDISLCWYITQYSSFRRRTPARQNSISLLRRRLPSWSWMGWQGDSMFPFDPEFESVASFDRGFTESITQFYIIGSPDDKTRNMVDCNWSQLRKTAADDVPIGWKRTEYKPPSHWNTDFYTTKYGPEVNPQSMPKYLPKYLYTQVLGATSHHSYTGTRSPW
ncbi:hypothetical protein FPOAC2_09731 [Fusarium poae]|uniref:Heterokaryon incompatibility domain-containing protein n=2 Tax=Fusarium poae TaxID=36050 RepID=A0A1B8APY4_FUSPO|nr:hypothetical protein FPOA_08909 [Fusarium poae]